MSFIKKQTAGVWMACATLLLACISLIVYKVNVSSEGYFVGKTVAGATKYSVVAIILLLVAIVCAQFEVEGAIGKIKTIITDAIRIAVPALFVAAALLTIAARVEGFAFIYFSNEEVLQEIQTAANLSSAHGAIANIVCLVITAIVGIVGAFFSTNRNK